MKKLIKQLITYQSDKNHPNEIKKIFNFVTDYLKKADLEVKTFSYKQIPSLIAARKLKKHYQFILNGHLDVVPADYKNAFKPIIRKSRLYGRGAGDMKGPAAALIKLMVDNDLKNVDMALILTSDEELGGYHGVDYLLNKIGFSSNCVIVPDGGKNFNLVLAEKGIFHIKFIAKGKTVHGSKPWLGDNALEKLINVFKEIKNKIPDTTPKNRWLPTVSLGRLVGGDATNKVPAYAEMFLDFRYPKKGQDKKILNLVKKYCRKFKVKFEIESYGDILKTSKNNKYLKKLLRKAKDLKIKMKLDKCHGASDARFFSAKGIPVIMTRPLVSDAHIDNEWIDLKSLEKFYNLLKSFLLDK